MCSLNNRKVFSHNFGCWNEGVGRIVFFWGIFSWLEDGHLFLVSSCGLPSGCVCIWITSFYKDTSHICLGTTIWPHVALMASSKALSPNTVIFWDTRSQDFNIQIWGDSIQPITIRAFSISRLSLEHPKVLSARVEKMSLFINTPVGLWKVLWKALTRWCVMNLQHPSSTCRDLGASLRLTGRLSYLCREGKGPDYPETQTSVLMPPRLMMTKETEQM